MTFTYNWKHKEACFGKPLQDQVDGGTHISFEIVPKKDGKYIAVQREGIPGHQPQAGLYFCHDLIRYGESVEACVKRLVQDQMGISVVHFRIVDIESDIQEKDNQWAFIPYVIAEVDAIPEDAVVFDKDSIPDGFAWWTQDEVKEFLEEFD